MARLARVLAPGLPRRITQRGNRRPGTRAETRPQGKAAERSWCSPELGLHGVRYAVPGTPHLSPELRIGSRDPPVGQGEGIAELLDTLVVGGVAGHKLQAVRQGDSGDHRIAAADGTADAVQIAGDMAG